MLDTFFLGCAPAEQGLLRPMSLEYPKVTLCWLLNSLSNLSLVIINTSAMKAMYAPQLQWSIRTQKQADRCTTAAVAKILHTDIICLNNIIYDFG